MLFENERLHFFRPLTGKYREQVVACLRVLYARLYSSLADYSRVVGHDLVLEVFQEAITRTAVLDDAEDDKSLPVRDAATSAADMNLLAWDWHALGKDLDGHWAVSVNGNWRLTFTFEGKDAILVDYQDYH
jgi:proteic killer suppression protein